MVKKIFYFILILAILVLSLKQIIRIKENFNKKNIWPNIRSFSENSEVNKFKKESFDNNFIIYVSDKECMYIKSPCTNNFNQNIFYKKIYGYDLIYKKK